jgi:hypothetical protein
MPNYIYNIAKQGLIAGTIAWGTGAGGDVIKARLVASTYTPNVDHTTMTDVGAGITGATDQTLASKANGVDNTGDFAYLDAADPTFPAVTAGGTQAYAVVVYKFVTNDAGSTPIAYCQLASPITPNGGDITVQFATPANGGIVKLT